MNMESMRIRSYRSFKVDEHVPAVAAGRYRTLKAYDRLRAAGCNDVPAVAAGRSAGARIGGSKAYAPASWRQRAGSPGERRAGGARDQPAHAVSVAWRRSRPAPAVSASGPGSPGTSRRFCKYPFMNPDVSSPSTRFPMAQGARPGHAGAQGPPSERVDGRPDHRTRLAVGAIRPDRSGRPRRSATGFSPRARAGKSSPSGGAASRRRRFRGGGDAVEVRLQGLQGRGTRATRFGAHRPT